MDIKNIPEPKNDKQYAIAAITILVGIGIGAIVQLFNSEVSHQ